MPSQATTRTPLQIQHVPLSRLREAGYNPRLMPSEEARKLRRSIEEFGFVEPIVVRRVDHTVIGGHQRLQAARSLGFTKVPVVYVDVSEQQAKLLNLALNRIHGEWDLARLGELLGELQDLPEIDESLAGFDPPELEDLLSVAENLSPFADEEHFDLAGQLAQAARRAERRVQVGDTWALGSHRLFCGDSLAEGNLARLCAGKPPALVLTDPPYGLDYDSQSIRRTGKAAKIANDGNLDYDEFLERMLSTLDGVLA